jgi:predicted secreted Zn-dependent protease
MRKKTRSILEELSSFRPKERSDEFIQTSGNNIIESAINLLTRIHETYDSQTAIELERRFINSIKAGNPKKFRSGIDRIIESKNK